MDLPDYMTEASALVFCNLNSILEASKGGWGKLTAYAILFPCGSTERYVGCERAVEGSGA